MSNGKPDFISEQEALSRRHIEELERLFISTMALEKVEPLFRRGIFEQEARKFANVKEAYEKGKEKLEAATSSEVHERARAESKEKGESLLIKAILAGNLQIVTSLLGKSGVDPNCKSEKGFTALSVAVRAIIDENVSNLHSRFFIVKALIEYGADPRKPNDNGNTPYGYVERLTTQYRDSREDLTDVEERGEVYVECRNMFDRYVEIFRKAQLYRVEIEEGIGRRAVQDQEYRTRQKLFPTVRKPRARVAEMVESAVEERAVVPEARKVEPVAVKEQAAVPLKIRPHYMKDTESWVNHVKAGKDRVPFERTLRG